MVDIATVLDKHLFPDLASIVLEYCQLEHVDKVIGGYRCAYTKLFGKKHGEHQFYYLTGELASSSHYVNDKLHGEYKWYHINGELASSKHYVNGKLHGEYKYYRTGEMYCSRHYVNGVEQ